jgi:serine/alanine adding enzyme
VALTLIQNPDKDFLEKWKDFDSRYNTYNIFQTPQMFEMFAHTDRYTPYLLAEVNDHGEIEATFTYHLYKGYRVTSSLLTKGSAVGLPIAIDQETREKMMCNIVSCKNKPYSLMKIVMDDDIQNISTIQPKHFGFQHESHLNYLIDVSLNETDLWKNISETRRKQIKRAEKRGLSVKIADYVDNTEEIYDILMETYIRSGLEKEDIDIFIQSSKFLTQTGNLKYFMAYAEEKLVAFRIQLIYKDYIYDWYAGNRTESQSLYPNDLLVWSVLKWANNNGYRQFNFGGAGKPNKPYGVREFKKKFGGRLIEYGYWIDTNTLFKPIYRVIKKWQKY